MKRRVLLGVALFVVGILLVLATFVRVERTETTVPARLPSGVRRPVPSDPPPTPSPVGTAPAAEPASQTLGRATWGSGPGQLGRERPQEGNPEAPMSLAFDRSGNAVVVDQVNNRLARFAPDGGPRPSLPLTVQAAQDVAIAQDGTTLVLDRLVDKSVAVMDPTGKLLGELPVEGKTLKEGGGVTGVFVDGKDVYLEREHGQVVRVGDTAGKADPEQPTVPGRPSRDGQSFLSAGIVDAAAGRLFVNSIQRSTMTHRFTRELRMGGRVVQIMLLDTDKSGRVYLAMLLDRGTPGVVLTCLDANDGNPLGMRELPPNISADETFRELAVSDEGEVVYLQRSETGAQLTRYTCP